MPKRPKKTSMDGLKSAVQFQLEERAECERAFLILRDPPHCRRRRSTFQKEEEDEKEEDGDSRNLPHFPGSLQDPGKESFSVIVVGQSERLPAVRIEVRACSLCIIVMVF